jgi:nickel-dependent lactate racemase
MFFIENLNGELKSSQIDEFLKSVLTDFKHVKKALIIHPDYTRADFSNRIVPFIFREFKKSGIRQIHFLNASGTHRGMSEIEFHSKLGITGEKGFTFFHNHEYNLSEQLKVIGEIPKNEVSEKTGGMLDQEIPVKVNKMVFEDHDLIIAISGTSPHEAAGYSGGLKIFFPGIAGTEVISLFHWAATLVGIPDIIGTINNHARDIINMGSSLIFNNITPIISLNMVSEENNNRLIPKALYAGIGYNGFLQTYNCAAEMSSKLHIIHLDNPLETAVQVIPGCYDEIWTAAKGSYKLQKPGVISKGGEIIIYAPHIKCFHSKPEIDSAIRQIGYHCKYYVQEFLCLNPGFNMNVAAHVINLRGAGTYSQTDKKEKFAFKVSLATGIAEEECLSVGLGYRHPDSITQEQFSGPGMLWIQDGGKFLFDIKN